MKPILEIKNISKKYKLRGQEMPYLTIRESLLGKNKHRVNNEFWALKDITFDVYPGESIGIIGKNGAGKSTLLKILSRITPPTKGEIIVRGRIASLLEVGTGFHPELTGMENIFLNGSILGLKKHEIKNKIDEIIDFAGVEKFIDTPLKHYSSGMQLRLAFAVAAHLEPEILIVDEVLAVGDAEFQKKSLGKMEEVTKQGRTVLFVTHNLNAVKAFCSKSILLSAGELIVQGESEFVIKSYLETIKVKDQKPDENADLIINEIFLTNKEQKKISIIEDDICFLNVRIFNKNKLKNIKFGFTIFNSNHVGLLSSLSSDYNVYLDKTENYIKIQLPTNLLHSGKYYIEAALFSDEKVFYQNDCLIEFEKISVNYNSVKGEKSKGLLNLKTKWEIN